MEVSHFTERILIFMFIESWVKAKSVLDLKELLIARNCVESLLIHSPAKTVSIKMGKLQLTSIETTSNVLGFH